MDPVTSDPIDLGRPLFEQAPKSKNDSIDTIIEAFQQQQNPQATRWVRTKQLARAIFAPLIALIAAAGLGLGVTALAHLEPFGLAHHAATAFGSADR